MLQGWMRKILLFSTSLVLLASCKDPEFSLDEPLVEEERSALYINGQNNFLYALDPNTGERIWEHFFGLNTIMQEPIALQGQVLVNSNLGIVRLDNKNGQVIDTIREVEFDGAKHGITGMISGQDAMLYFGTTSNYLVGYNMVDKSVVWRAPSFAGGLTFTGSFFGNLFIACVGSNIYALNKNAGTEVSWTYATPGAINDPVIAAPNMYVLDKSGVLHSIDLETGVESWTYTTGAPTSTSPIVYGGNIIYGSDNNYLYCIDSIARAPRWTFLTSERIKGSAYAYEQSVYFGGYDHYIYALNIIDGEVRWRYRAGALINGSPVANNGKMYVGSYDQHLYAFDTSGALTWKFKVNSPVDFSPVVNNLDNKVVYPAPSGLSAQ